MGVAMNILNNVFNNREIAVFIWLVVLIGWAASRRDVRKSFGSVLKAFLVKPIITAVGLLLFYVGGMIVLFYALELWNASHLKDTIFWLLGTAFVMLMDINPVQRDENYFKKVLLDNTKFILIFEFLVNFYVFELWIEIILIPAITILGMLQIVAGTKPEFKSAKTFFDIVTAIIGIVLLFFAIYNAVLNFRGFATVDTLKAFLLGPVFTAALLPFVYMTALFVAYEQVYIRMKIFNKDRKLVRYAMWRILFTFHLNMGKLNRWSKRAGTLRIQSKADVRTMLTENYRP